MEQGDKHIICNSLVP